jgi:hypothetical protein
MFKPLVYPADWLFRDPGVPLSDFGRRLLAEGDSWFTIGSLNLPDASNMLFPLRFAKSTVIVNCAYPGDTLDHIADNLRDPYFDALLRQPNFASFWEAVLLSAGGNDLIDAAQSPPFGPDGLPTPLAERLLLTPGEAAQQPDDLTGPERFISEPGWKSMEYYLRINLAELVRRRDEGPSAGRPLFLHTYSTPTVWRHGSLGASRGWLFEAFTTYGIAPIEQQPIAALLFERLRRLLLSVDQGSASGHALPHVHVFDSAGEVALDPPDPQARSTSGDWVNEIHPSPTGYKKLAAAFGLFIDKVLSRYPG